MAERAAPSSFELVGGEQGPDPARFRRAVKRIPSLPRVRVRIAVPADPILRYGADVLYGQWREAGLGPRLVSESSKAEAWLRRAVAAYPQEEAIPADLLLGGSLDPAPGRGELVRSLGESRQRGTLERVDEQLGAAAAVIPVAWVADARLVSPRLRGWREDVLGDVDYEAVTTAAQ